MGKERALIDKAHVVGSQESDIAAFKKEFSNAENLLKPCAGYNCFEYMILENKIEHLPYVSLYEDQENTLKLLDLVVKRGYLFSHKDHLQRFLIVLSTLITISEKNLDGTYRDKYRGVSLLHLWVASQKFDGFQVLLKHMNEKKTSVDIECFVEALFADLIVYEANMQSTLFFQLSLTDSGINILLSILENSLSVFMNPGLGERVHETRIFNAIMNPVKWGYYEDLTAFANFIRSNQGVTFLDILQKNKLIFPNNVDHFFKFLKLSGDIEPIKKIGERKFGHNLLLRWLIEIDGLLIKFVEEDSLLIFNVLTSISLSTLSEYGEGLSVRLLEHSEGASEYDAPILKLLEIKDVDLWLFELIQIEVFKVSPEMKKVLLKLHRKQNVLEILYDKTNDGAQIAELLSEKTSIKGEEAFLVKGILKGNKDGPLMYHFTKPSKAIGGNPIISLLKYFPEEIIKNIEDFSGELLVVPDGESVCGLMNLLSYPKGRECLLDYQRIVPELIFYIIGQKISMRHFAMTPDGRACFFNLLNISDYYAWRRNNHVIISGFEHTESGRNMLSHFLEHEDGQKILYKLMEKLPAMFNGQQYIKRWAVLLTATIDNAASPINKFSILNSLAWEKKGVVFLARYLARFPEVFREHVDMFVRGLVSPVTHNKDFYGRNALMGLLTSEEGRENLAYIFKHYPSVTEGENGYQVLNGMVTSAAIVNGEKVTAMTLMVRAEGISTLSGWYDSCSALIKKNREFFFGAIYLKDFANNLFSIPDNNYPPYLSFLKDDYWLLSELVTRLKKIKDFKFESFWEAVMVYYYYYGQKGYYIFEHFSNSQTSCLLLIDLMGFSPPPSSPKLLMDILSAKTLCRDAVVSTEMKTVEDCFRRYEAGLQALSQIKKSCFSDDDLESVDLYSPEPVVSGGSKAEKLKEHV